MGCWWRWGTLPKIPYDWGFSTPILLVQYGRSVMFCDFLGDFVRHLKSTLSQAWRCLSYFCIAWPIINATKSSKKRETSPSSQNMPKHKFWGWQKKGAVGILNYFSPSSWASSFSKFFSVKVFPVNRTCLSHNVHNTTGSATSDDPSTGPCCGLQEGNVNHHHSKVHACVSNKMGMT